ncbi:hypothetical protein N7462_008088 [Penicillium macrosclerotiorum]|uniref:uncharacterized protein n=1 Tax=Penicillium macrosclerotiorum TaxID=303699 RepID=UPI0025497957|nr:uncharacterized protein N7462_008088 [Penicillium macrosclerotiorum]KAJ5679844.1 hypothetical protein N7462_008088 [Penicillium macrosclerotiorum]
MKKLLRGIQESILTRLLRKQVFRETLIRYLAQDDLVCCRLVCRTLAVQLAPYLFANITIVFRSRTLTRPSRISALERIGTHIQTMTFTMPHTAETFLPPVIDPVTGREMNFIYMPQHQQMTHRSPKYGTWEMTSWLVQQYPPVFHAATDIPSFVRALSMMENLRHLRINCAGQLPSHRYRRSAVDYALISLRIAIERAPRIALDTVSLQSVHPAAVFYLQPNGGFGASPASRKRWSQVRHLTVHMESFPHHVGLPTDHFKLIHAYLQSFSELRTLAFHWIGERGPSPVSLATEQKLPTAACACPVSIQCTSGSEGPGRSRRLIYGFLQQLELFNVTMDASQVAAFILDHRHSLSDLNLRDITLRRGTWADALAPLTWLGGSDRWKQEQRQDGGDDVLPTMRNIASAG